MNNHASALYDKLNNVHASLRKQRDDAYRTKQLAENRLQIARQDRENLEKAGGEMKVRLQKLREVAVEMKGVNGRVEAENKLMEKEYNFQHAELQSKKEKLSRLEDKRNIEANSRHHSLSSAREMLRRLREDSSKNNDSGNAYRHASSSNHLLSSEEKRRKLEQTMEVDGGEQLIKNLPELVRMRKVQKLEEVKNVEMRNDSLRRIIVGYQNALGGSSSLEMMMQQGNQQQGNPVLQQ